MNVNISIRPNTKLDTNNMVIKNNSSHIVNKSNELLVIALDNTIRHK